mmetsp:Transcript_32661/g.76166  ORF Transcript_32661/g.76166 Transcript_32661/m.76166 type:complete len:239 (-) Transcript_32661:888-1604(-)
MSSRHATTRATAAAVAATAASAQCMPPPTLSMTLCSARIARTARTRSSRTSRPKRARRMTMRCCCSSRAVCCSRAHPRAADASRSNSRERQRARARPLPTAAATPPSARRRSATTTRLSFRPSLPLTPAYTRAGLRCARRAAILRAVCSRRSSRGPWRPPRTTRYASRSAAALTRWPRAGATLALLSTCRSPLSTREAQRARSSRSRSPSLETRPLTRRREWRVRKRRRSACCCMAAA